MSTPYVYYLTYEEKFSCSSCLSHKKILHRERQRFALQQKLEELFAQFGSESLRWENENCLSVHLGFSNISAKFYSLYNQVKNLVISHGFVFGDLKMDSYIYYSREAAEF